MRAIIDPWANPVISALAIFISIGVAISSSGARPAQFVLGGAAGAAEALPVGAGVGAVPSAAGLSCTVEK